MFTLAVSTAMFMLDACDNLRPLRSGKPPAVLGLDSGALVVQLPGVDVGVDRDRSVVTSHAALVRFTQRPPHQAIIKPLGAGEPKSFTYNFHKYQPEINLNPMQCYAAIKSPVCMYSISIIHLKHSQHDVKTYPSV